jgi:recombination associated protein RdgC
VTLLRGVLTFRRFEMDGPPPSSSAALIDLLQRDGFRGSLQQPTGEERSGWVTLENLLETDFPLETTYRPPYLVFALRTDRKAIPPLLLRAMMDRETRAFLAETGLERLPHGARDEIRERLEDQYLPGQLPTVAITEASWNLVSNRLLVMASSDKAVDRFRKHFSATLSRAALPLGPARLAGRDDIEEAFLGREFLLWLWYRSEAGFGRLAGASGFEVDLWVDDRLLLRGEGEDAQRFDLRGGAPAASATARTAMVEGRTVYAARFGLRREEREYAFELREDLSIRGLKLPDLEADEEDPVLGRLSEVEMLTEHLDDLFAAFCAQRLAATWEEDEVPRIQGWLEEGVLGNQGGEREP